MKKRPSNKYIWLCIILLVSTLILNALAFVPGFSDWYCVHVYRYLAVGIGHVTDILPFLLGEVIMYTVGVMGVVFVLWILLYILLQLGHLAGKLRHLQKGASKTSPVQTCGKNSTVDISAERPDGAAASPQKDEASTSSQPVGVLSRRIDATTSSQYAGTSVRPQPSDASALAMHEHRFAMRLFIIYLKLCAMLLCISIFLYTILWMVPFRSSELTFGTDADKTYTIADIVALRNQMTGELNALTAAVERDENGYVIIPEDVMILTGEAVAGFPTVESKYWDDVDNITDSNLQSSDLGITNSANSSAADDGSNDGAGTDRVGADGAGADGVGTDGAEEPNEAVGIEGSERTSNTTWISSVGAFTPQAKYATCSMFLEWMGIGGYTFPYTQEVCINKYVNDFYFPSLYAHELAHHMGFYREDEGNFISYIALKDSDDLFLQYTGTYTAWCYVQSAYVRNVRKLSEEGQEEIISEAVTLDERVLMDYAYYEALSEARYEAEVSSTLEDAFKSSSESVSNVGWQVQGDLLGKASYNGVVELLLRYFEGRGLL